MKSCLRPNGDNFQVDDHASVCDSELLSDFYCGQFSMQVGCSNGLDFDLPAVWRVQDRLGLHGRIIGEAFL